MRAIIRDEVTAALRDLNTNNKVCDDNTKSNDTKTSNRIAIAEIIVPVVIAIIGFGIAVKSDIKGLETSRNYLENEVSEIKTGIKELSTKVEDLDKKVEPIILKENQSALLAPDDMEMPFSSSGGIPATPVNYSKDAIIGTSFGEYSKTYTVGDVIGKPVLLTYSDNKKENNHEVYFHGQFNENCHWDGQCITNAYYIDSGRLYSVCVYDMDDGVCKKYKSFFRTYGENKWIYSDRVCTKDGNKGISNTFTYKCPIIKDFDTEEAKVLNLLYLEDFDISNMVLSKHYNGLTKGGYYNDTTGSAYEIKLNKDGFITNLYIGDFVNGDHVDDSRNAIEISYDIKVGKYLFFKGVFEDDKQIQAIEQKYVTKQQIDDILGKNHLI